MKLGNSPKVYMVKKVKNRIKDYLDKCTIDEIVNIAIYAKIKVPNQLLTPEKSIRKDQE